MPALPQRPLRYFQVGPETTQTVDTEIVVEIPVGLTVNGVEWLTLMATPVDLADLAVGFLFNEGLISHAAEVLSVRPCASGENVDVWLSHPVEKPSNWRRTSGCTGGTTSTEADPAEAPLPVTLQLPAAQISALIGQLLDAQDLYRRSGGIHTSAIADGHTLLHTAEDIGRHNTLDKLAGHMLRTGLNPAQRVLLTTGRLSSEMLQKASRLEAEIVISRTSPTSLSLDLAAARGITLIGYARRDRFNLYTHPNRVLDAQISALGDPK
jgi:FdhD protein